MKAPPDDWIMVPSAMVAEVKRLRGRVQDLLAANNRYLERARKAEDALAERTPDDAPR